jgi:hypothetical protein
MRTIRRRHQRCTTNLMNPRRFPWVSWRLWTIVMGKQTTFWRRGPMRRFRISCRERRRMLNCGMIYFTRVAERWNYPNVLVKSFTGGSRSKVLRFWHRNNPITRRCYGSLTAQRKRSTTYLSCHHMRHTRH